MRPAEEKRETMCLVNIHSHDIYWGQIKIKKVNTAFTGKRLGAK